LIRSFRGVEDFDNFRAIPLLVDELERRDEEVKVKSPFSKVEIIEQGNCFRFVKSQVTNKLANVSPVLFFNMSIIIFLVFSGTSVLNGILSMSNSPYAEK